MVFTFSNYSDKEKALISTMVSVFLILIFFVFFPVSPLTDLIGLIETGFAPYTLSPYYVTYTIFQNPSYQVFQMIVFVIQFFIGDNLPVTCVIFMCLIFLLLFYILYFLVTLSEENNYHALCIMPALAFLLMHTTLFTWGTVPFIISSWLAIIASFFFLKFYMLSNTNGFAVTNKWLILSIFTGLLSGFTHPVGIQIYLLGINFFILLIVLENKNRLQHFLTILFVDILFIIYDFMTLESFNQISAKNFYLEKIVNFNLFDRIGWSVIGGGYNTSFLFPERISTIEPYIINILGLLPFICLMLGIHLIIINKKKKEIVNTVNILATYLLFFICAGIVFLPVNIGALTMPYLRMYAVATPLLLIIIFNVSNLIKVRIPVIFGPILTILILLSFVPAYSATQNIIPFSDNVTINLEQKIIELRDTLPENEKNLPVLVSYSPSLFGEKNFEYRIVPFIIMNNKTLSNNDIIIISEWAPVAGGRSFNYSYLSTIKTKHVIWETEKYPDINLTVANGNPQPFSN